MSKNTKIILGIIGGVIVLCMCVCLGGWAALKIGGSSLAETMAIEDPAEAASLGHAMLDYTLPAGYQEKFAVNFFVMKMVLISRGEANIQDPSQTMIMIAEFPSSFVSNEEEMRDQLRQQMNQSVGERNWKMELVEETSRMIGSQPVTLLVYEGVDENGTPMRQIISNTFSSKNGQIMLWMAGSKASWDQSAIDAFINSIR